MNSTLVIIIFVLLGVIAFLQRRKLKTFIDFMLKNKKISIPVIIGLLVVIVVLVVYSSNSTPTNYTKKLKRYLESIGYNCNNKSINDDGDVMDDHFSCKITERNGIEKEIKINEKTKNSQGIYYYEEAYGAYKISIPAGKYKISRGIIRYKDYIENKTFNFATGEKINIGTIVKCENQSSKYKEICEDNVKDVNNALREVESIFNGAGVKLQ